MLKLKVLEVTDAKENNENYYTKQLEAITKGRRLSDMDFILTEDNVIIYALPEPQNIDIENPDIKKAIELGAIVKEIFYVEDNRFTDHYLFKNNINSDWDDFEGNASYVEYEEEHGVAFEMEDDAKLYEFVLNLENYFNKNHDCESVAEFEWQFDGVIKTIFASRLH